MANGIDNEFKYRVQRKFVTSRSGTIRSVVATDFARNMRHHEISRLICQLKDISLVDLMVRHWLFNASSIEPSALDLGVDEIPLGLLPEKKNSRIRKTPVFTHEIKMRQQILCRS